MKLLIIISGILWFSTAHADWTLIQCTPNVAAMNGNRGSLISAPSCGTQKICQVEGICEHVDSGALKVFGGIDKMSQEEILKYSWISFEKQVCAADGDHCPEFSKCWQGTAGVKSTFDDPMSQLSPSTPKTPGEQAI